MLTTYDATANQSLPLLLAKDAASARRHRAFQRLGSALLVLTATAVGSAALALEDPLAPLVAVSTSFSNVIASMSNQAPVGSVAPSADSSASTRFATAAAAEPATPDQPATADGSSDTLKQFLAWANDQEQQERIEAQARQQPAAQPANVALAADDVTASIVAEDSTSVQMQGADARIRNAWAELAPVQQSRARTSRTTHASAKPTATAQAAPAHNLQPPSLLRVFGWHG